MSNRLTIQEWEVSANGFTYRTEYYLMFNGERVCVCDFKPKYIKEINRLLKIADEVEKNGW